MRVKRFFKYFGIGVAILIGGVLIAGQIAHSILNLVYRPPMPVNKEESGL